MYEKKTKLKFTKQEIKIMQKAKAYKVDALSNHTVAKELFGLIFEQDLRSAEIETLLQLYHACDESINMAQVSS